MVDNDKNKALLVAIRRALLMAVGAIEDYMGMERDKRKGK